MNLQTNDGRRKGRFREGTGEFTIKTLVASFTWKGL